MAYVLILRDTPDKREQSWILLGTAHKLALSVSRLAFLIPSTQTEQLSGC